MRRVVLALLFIAVPALCHAWGEKGHKTVAVMSLEFLDNAGRNGVEELLGDDFAVYVDASIFADQIRNSRPETKPWHFVDIPADAAGFDSARDCKNGDCVVAKITEFADRVADRKLTQASRREALKFVIHFVGDIHQPLHDADDNDRGGNDVFVRIAGITDKLHSWWDTQLVNRILPDVVGTPSDIAENLLTRVSDDDVRNWSRGTPKDWAEESHKIAHDFIYARSRGPNTEATPIILPDSYLDDAIPIVRSRLAMASVRLAMVLNQAFGK